MFPRPPSSTLGHAHAARSVSAAAFLCGIHCLTSPVLAAVIPVLAIGERAEWALLAVTVATGIVVTVLGPARGRGSVLALLAAGSGLWIASLSGALQPLPEALTSGSGGLLFAGGMLWSARICHRNACEKCER